MPDYKHILICSHKNPIIRTTAARLLICVCGIHGVDTLIGSNANPHTRKRMLASLAKFLGDKSQDTRLASYMFYEKIILQRFFRKYAERLCQMLAKHRHFQEYFYKDLEANVKSSLRKIINNMVPK